MNIELNLEELNNLLEVAQHVQNHNFEMITLEDEVSTTNMFDVTQIKSMVDYLEWYERELHPEDDAIPEKYTDLKIKLKTLL